MMRSRGGHALAESSNRGLSQRVRTSPRVFLRLEMLETRCLLSGWSQMVGPDIGRPPAVERPAYVIVPEISRPHHTIASAQVLPDRPYVGVFGTLAGDEIDFYKLALDSIPERLDFGLVMQGRGGSVPATFQILDGSGQVLGTWNLGSVGNSSIQIDP